MSVRTCSSRIGLVGFMALASLMSCVSVGPSMPASLADVANVDVVDVANLPPAPRNVRAERLLETRVVRFEERDGEVVTTEYMLKRTRILNRQGQRDRAAVLSYDLTFDEVLRHRAWVHDPDGGVVEIEGSTDVPSFGTWQLYSDIRRRGISIPEVELGSVIEEEREIRRRRSELWRQGMFFGGELPVHEATLVVEFPAGWVVESLVTVDGEAIEWPPTVTTASDGGQRYMWRREHLPALIGAPGAEGANQLVAVAVRLRSATLSSGGVVEGPADAAGLSRFEAELIGPPVLSPTLRALASKILEAAGKPNEMSADEKAAHLYAWTREQIAYCAITVGLGGWIPHEPERVEAARYGDCKDKANLLRALLASVDIRSRLVGIYAGGAPRPFGFPVLGANFNHMILEIQLEDGVVYVDPTTRTVPFGELPAADKGRLCLPLDPAGASLVLTPSTSPKADRVVSTWTLTLLSDGRFMGRVRSILNGSFADSARDDYVTMPPRLLPRAMRRWVGGRGTLSNVVVYGGPPPLRRAPFIAQAQFYSDADARAATGPYGTLSAMEILTTGGFAVDDRRRASPFEIGAQSGREDKVELHLPKGVRVVRIPPPLTVTSPYVSAVVRWEVENAGEDVVLRLTRELNYTAERVPAEDVAGFREDHQRYWSALEARVVFASPEGS